MQWAAPSPSTPALWQPPGHPLHVNRQAVVQIMVTGEKWGFITQSGYRNRKWHGTRETRKPIHWSKAGAGKVWKKTVLSLKEKVLSGTLPDVNFKSQTETLATLHLHTGFVQKLHNLAELCFPPLWSGNSYSLENRTKDYRNNSSIHAPSPSSLLSLWGPTSHPGALLIAHGGPQWPITPAGSCSLPSIGCVWPLCR